MPWITSLLWLDAVDVLCAGYPDSALVGDGSRDGDGDGDGDSDGNGDGEVGMPAVLAPAAPPAGHAQVGRLELQVPGLQGLSVPGMRVLQA